MHYSIEPRDKILNLKPDKIEDKTTSASKSLIKQVYQMNEIYSRKKATNYQWIKINVI